MLVMFWSALFSYSLSIFMSILSFGVVEFGFMRKYYLVYAKIGLQYLSMVYMYAGVFSIHLLFI